MDALLEEATRRFNQRSPDHLPISFSSTNGRLPQIDTVLPLATDTNLITEPTDTSKNGTLIEIQSSTDPWSNIAKTESELEPEISLSKDRAPLLKRRRLICNNSDGSEVVDGSMNDLDSKDPESQVSETESTVCIKENYMSNKRKADTEFLEILATLALNTNPISQNRDSTALDSEYSHPQMDVDMDATHSQNVLAKAESHDLDLLPEDNSKIASDNIKQPSTSELINECPHIEQATSVLSQDCELQLGRTPLISSASISPERGPITQSLEITFSDTSVTPPAKRQRIEPPENDDCIIVRYDFENVIPLLFILFHSLF